MQTNYQVMFTDNAQSWIKHKKRQIIVFNLPMLCLTLWSKKLRRFCLQWALARASTKVVVPTSQTPQYLCHWKQEFLEEQNYWIQWHETVLVQNRTIPNGFRLHNVYTLVHISHIVGLTTKRLLLLKRFVEVKVQALFFVFNAFVHVSFQYNKTRYTVMVKAQEND